MGRIAGVSAAEIRERLLDAAADVFAEFGYAGTRVAEIAKVAGVSNAALYAHFGSKAELLVEALRLRGPQLLADVLRTEPDQPVGGVLLAAGRRLPRKRGARGYLIVEALVAARRDRRVAALMRSHLGERAAWLADLVRAGQVSGDLDPSLSAEAVARFCMLLALGSALLPHEPGGGGPEWDHLLRRLVGALTGPDPPRRDIVKVHLDADRCQGHGRCYDLAPEVFGEDGEGYGVVLVNGVVPPDVQAAARLAAANCPESAIVIEEEKERA